MNILKRSLKAKIVAYFWILSILVIAGLGAVAYSRSTNTLEQEVSTRLEIVANEREHRLSQFVESQERNLVTITLLPAVRGAAEQLLASKVNTVAYNASYDTLRRLLASLTFRYSEFGDILFLSPRDGEIFFSTNKSQEGGFRQIDGSVVPSENPSLEDRAPTITVTTPLLNNVGGPIGIVAADLNLTELTGLVSDPTSMGETGEVYLVDSNNLFVTPEESNQRDSLQVVHSEGIDAAVSGERGTGVYKNYAGEQVIGAYQWVAERNLAIVAEMHTSEALEPAQQLGLTILGVGLAAAALLTIGVYLVARRIVNPIQAITEATKKIAGGDLTQRAPVLTEDEIGTLAKNFNIMTSQLRSTLIDLETEQEKSERLLLNILPGPIADRLKQGEENIADSYAEVSVLFADLVGFTKLSARVTPNQLIELLNQIFSGFDELSDRHKLEKIKTIGDAYMIVGGLPTPRPDHAEAIAEMALDMQRFITRFNEETDNELDIRIGINSGPVVAGVVGTKKFLYDIWGDAVNTAARMESHGVEGRIHVTSETYLLLRDKFEFEDRGIIEVKGKGDMHTYLLKGERIPTAADGSVA